MPKKTKRLAAKRRQERSIDRAREVPDVGRGPRCEREHPISEHGFSTTGACDACECVCFNAAEE